MQGRIAVVLNPASRSGGAGHSKDLVLRLAEQSAVKVCLTSRAGEGTELARQLASDGLDRVVTVGGDGTINEVMNGLVGTDSALAVIPTGTGNDWVRTVGIPNDPKKAWDIALNGTIVDCDVGEAVGHRFFLNVAGVGFDAEVARKISDDRGLSAKLSPKPRYVVSVMQTFFGFRGADAVLKQDGKSDHIDKMFLLAVAVAKYYGSGMMIAPEAEIDDGQFDLVWGADVKSAELPGLLSMIFKGRHTGHRKVGASRCKEVTVSADPPMPFHVDGDVVGETPVTFRIHEKALKIVVP